jgi:hypothetical protein
MATDSGEDQRNVVETVAETSNAEVLGESGDNVVTTSTGFVYWREKLRSARLVVAPMVDQRYFFRVSQRQIQLLCCDFSELAYSIFN